MGSRRHRGRGGNARPARLSGPADRRGRSLQRRSSRGRDRDRPRADAHRDAAQARRRRQVRRVLRRRPVDAVSARPRDAQQHVPRVRRHIGAVSCRRADAALPRDHGPQRRPHRAGRALQQGAGSLQGRRRSNPTFQRAARARPRHGRAQRRRPQAAAGSRLAAQGVGELHVGVCAQPEARARGHLEVDRRGRPDRRPGVGRGRTPPPGQRRGRVCGHRRDHQLHQHLEPFGDGGRGLARAEGGGARADREPLRQDQPCARLARGHRLFEHRGLDGAAGKARLLPGRLRLHDVHRQLRTAGNARGRGGCDRRQPQRRRGAVGQPEFRGPHPSAGKGELPGLATAGRRVRAGRHRTDRPEQGSDRH